MTGIEQIGKRAVTRAGTLAELAAMIEAVEVGYTTDAKASISTGLAVPLDRLDCGVVHEWLGADAAGGEAWTAPLLLFAHLARRALTGDRAGGLVVWIGRRLWPQPQVLLASATDRERVLLDRSLLVDPSSCGDRLWAIDLCLRSSGVAAVIADASRITLAHSRRLQLAAEAGSAVGLLARPARDQATLSAASTRWRVGHVPSPGSCPRWSVELMRCKGVQRGRGRDGCASLVLEHDHATGVFRVPADLADRPDQADDAARRTA